MYPLVSHQQNEDTFISPYVMQIQQLIIENDLTPYFVTTSFTNIDASITAKIAFCFKQYDRFYRHLVSDLMNNYTRKFHLHPRTYDFVDFPNSRKNQAHTNDPKTPHIHSIFLVHPDTKSAFEQMMSEQFAQIVSHPSMRPVIQCYAEPITHDLEHVVSYAAKFMLSSSSAFLRSQQIDLMTQYPKSVSELASRHSRKEQIHPDTIREMIRASSSNLAAKLPANDDESARYAAMFSDL